MSQGEGSAVGKALLDFSSKWILPFILAFVSWQFTEIRNLNDRVTSLQRDSVSHATLQITKQEIFGYMDVRMTDVLARQEQANKYLQILIEQSKGNQTRR